MKTTLSIALFLLGIVLLSCNKQDKTCPETVNKGDLNYTQNSFASIQTYLGKTTAIFRDSLNQEIIFSIVDRGDSIRPHLFAGTCESNPGQRVFFNYNAKERRIELRNDSLGTFFITLNTRLAFQSYEEYDYLSITNTVSNKSQVQQLTLLVDRKNVSENQANEINSNIVLEAEIQILGKLFFQAYGMKYPQEDNVVNKLYYNLEFGIISFKDMTKKTWVFDHSF